MRDIYSSALVVQNILFWHSETNAGNDLVDNINKLRSTFFF